MTKKNAFFRNWKFFFCISVVHVPREYMCTWTLNSAFIYFLAVISLTVTGWCFCCDNIKWQCLLNKFLFKKGMRELLWQNTTDRHSQRWCSFNIKTIFCLSFLAYFTARWTPSVMLYDKTADGAAGFPANWRLRSDCRDQSRMINFNARLLL